MTKNLEMDSLQSAETPRSLTAVLLYDLTGLRPALYSAFMQDRLLVVLSRVQIFLLFSVEKGKPLHSFMLF